MTSIPPEVAQGGEGINMNLTLEGTAIKICLVDLFEQMDMDAKQEIIEILAWESPILDAVIEIVNNEHAAPRLNRDIFKIRTAFLQSDDAPEHISDVVSALVHELKMERQNREALNALYWRVFRWYQVKYDDTLPDDLRIPGLGYPSHPGITEVNDFIKSLEK